MQLNIATPAPMQVIASVDPRTRSNASADATTLVVDGQQLGAAELDLDAAIASATEATRGAATGAAAIFETADGFVARAVRELPHGSPYAIERSRAKGTLVTGRMDVHDTTLRAIVDGRRIERMPDYAAAAPASWQDQKLLELKMNDGATGWSFSTQRRDGARTTDSHFTNVGADWDKALARATKSVRSDYFKQALMLLKGDDGSFYMSAFEGARGLLDTPGRAGQSTPTDALASVRAVNSAVQAIVGASSVVDLRGRTGQDVTPG